MYVFKASKLCQGCTECYNVTGNLYFMWIIRYFAIVIATSAMERVVHREVHND